MAVLGLFIEVAVPSLGLEHCQGAGQPATAPNPSCIMSIGCFGCWRLNNELNLIFTEHTKVARNKLTHKFIRMQLQ